MSLKTGLPREVTCDSSDTAVEHIGVQLLPVKLETDPSIVVKRLAGSYETHRVTGEMWASSETSKHAFREYTHALRTTNNTYRLLLLVVPNEVRFKTACTRLQRVVK